MVSPASQCTSERFDISPHHCCPANYAGQMIEKPSPQTCWTNQIFSLASIWERFSIYCHHGCCDDGGGRLVSESNIPLPRPLQDWRLLPGNLSAAQTLECLVVLRIDLGYIHFIDGLGSCSVFTFMCSSRIYDSFDTPLNLYWNTLATKTRKFAFGLGKMSTLFC